MTDISSEAMQGILTGSCIMFSICLVIDTFVNSAFFVSRVRNLEQEVKDLHEEVSDLRHEFISKDTD